MRQHDTSRSKAIVLMSGGMDSCATAAIAAQENDLAALHCSYGQLTEVRERRAFQDIADFYGIRERLLIDLPHLGRIGGSALTDERIPLRDADLEATDIPTSYVPFRNAHFLATAVSWGEVIGAEKIYIGAVEPDSSGYPDCRPGYYRIFNQLIAAGTRPETRLEIVAPLIHLRKHEIVKKGIELGAPFHLSWSCYRSSEQACGTCDSCALRLRAFEEAGVEDSIPYRSRPRYHLHPAG
jgi:7-cyano-7-deazaguanine synthase